jgi:hypothetical protein
VIDTAASPVAAATEVSGGPATVEAPAESGKAATAVDSKQPQGETVPGPGAEAVQEQAVNQPRPETTSEAGTPTQAAAAEAPVESSAAPEDVDHGTELAAAAAGVGISETTGATASKSAGTPTERATTGASAAAVESNEAIVEPLRADEPSQDEGPRGAADRTPEAAHNAPEPPPADVVAALEAWLEADPSTTDLTVVALRADEPAADLKPSDFRLEIGGREVRIEAVGGRDNAPLQLGVAVDVATGTSAAWTRPGGGLFPLVQRAGEGRGDVFFAADGQVGTWDGGLQSPREGSHGEAGGELTSLIVDSLDRFEGRRGRTFLIVVTDGRTDADKAAWKRATETVANAGVPVLVIALWDEDFSNRVRKNLSKIADSSGGGLFLVLGSDQLDRAVERFGPMLDGGVALRFVVPSGVQLPASVAVTTEGTGLEITAPEGVR